MAYTTINKSTDYFNTKLYTGNSTDNHAITSVGFKSDFTWIKARANSYDHMLFDALRGTASLRENLRSNTNSASDNDASNMKTLDSDGFTLGTGGYVNNSVSFASWNWKAGGAGSANGDGDINSTVSVNTTSGFSIVSYTGNGSTATVGHGLGVVPQVIIIKCTSNTSNWQFYHQDLGNNKKLLLNTTGAEASSGFMNNTSPTSSVFTVINDVDVGQSGYTYVAYCFAEKTGFSKFGSYTGNGNADGAFIYTGFKPAFTLIKRSAGGTESWYINDNKRSATGGTNPNHYYLLPNDNAAEGTSTSLKIDLLSNGFKIRNTDTSYNTSGSTYIFMAFAEAPLVGSNNVPANAR